MGYVFIWGKSPHLKKTIVSTTPAVQREKMVCGAPTMGMHMRIDRQSSGVQVRSGKQKGVMTEDEE